MGQRKCRQDAYWWRFSFEDELGSMVDNQDLEQTFTELSGTVNFEGLLRGVLIILALFERISNDRASGESDE